MIPRASFIPTILLLAMILHTLSRGGPKPCACGLEPGDEIDYDGPISDDFSPEPRVAAISDESGKKTIRIELSIPNAQSSIQDVFFRTSNFGRTWVKEKTKITKLPEFSDTIEYYHPPMRYKLPLAGGSLQRSPDDGKHWSRALLRLGSPPASETSEYSIETNHSYLRLELAAIHPSSPTILYGCFSAVTELEKSATPPQRVRSLAGVYMSRDGGDHWSLFSNDFRRRSFEEPCLLGINPYNPNIMLLHGQSGLIITRDGGKNWTPAGEQLQLEEPAHLRGYKEALEGLKSKSILPQKPWPFDWTFLAITNIVFEPRSEDVIYLVTNKGLYCTRDSGQTWCLLVTGDKTLFGVGSVFIDESNPSLLFVGSKGKILISKDGGCHFGVFFDSAHLPAAQ